MKDLRKNKRHLMIMSLAGLLAVSSWIITLYFWDKLPSTIPTHFGFNGQPDAWQEKSLFWAFFIPALQTIMFGLFLFLYEKPQYSDMPTTLLLTSFPKESKDHAFSLIRTTLLGTSLWIGLLFTYLSYAICASALSKIVGPSPWIMGGLIIGMLLWLIWWTLKIYQHTKKFLKNNS